MQSETATHPVFRMDRFVVPLGSAPAFTERLHHIQKTLGTMSGCRQNLVLTQHAAASSVTMATLVEWESAQAAAVARDLVQKKYADEGFDPASFIQKLGVQAEFGMYNTL
jgi:heme-degrading monooxygenase HmoA